MPIKRQEITVVVPRCTDYNVTAVVDGALAVHKDPESKFYYVRHLPTGYHLAASIKGYRHAMAAMKEFIATKIPWEDDKIIAIGSLKITPDQRRMCDEIRRKYQERAG